MKEKVVLRVYFLRKHLALRENVAKFAIIVNTLILHR